MLRKAIQQFRNRGVILLLPESDDAGEFVHMERIAEKGFQSIRIILDANIEDPKFDIDSLITELYAWGSELRLIGGARPQLQPPRIQPPVTMGTASSAAAPARAMLARALARPTTYGR